MPLSYVHTGFIKHYAAVHNGKGQIQIGKFFALKSKFFCFNFTFALNSFEVVKIYITVYLRRISVNGKR